MLLHTMPSLVLHENIGIIAGWWWKHPAGNLYVCTAAFSVHAICKYSLVCSSYKIQASGDMPLWCHKSLGCIMGILDRWLLIKSLFSYQFYRPLSLHADHKKNQQNDKDHRHFYLEVRKKVKYFCKMFLESTPFSSLPTQTIPKLYTLLVMVRNRTTLTYGGVSRLSVFTITGGGFA